jgi:hypothetical protein
MKTLVITALALVAAASAAAAPSTTTTLNLTEKQTFQHYVDNGVKGESSGDIRTFGGPVYAAGKRVGHDRIRCVVGSACSETLWLDGGTLYAKNVLVRPPRFTAAIWRGTGSYTGMHGTAQITLGKVSRYTIRLTR